MSQSSRPCGSGRLSRSSRPSGPAPPLRSTSSFGLKSEGPSSSKNLTLFVLGRRTRNCVPPTRCLIPAARTENTTLWLDRGPAPVPMFQSPTSEPAYGFVRLPFSSLIRMLMLLMILSLSSEMAAFCLTYSPIRSLALLPFNFTTKEILSLFSTTADSIS